MSHTFPFKRYGGFVDTPGRPAERGTPVIGRLVRTLAAAVIAAATASTAWWMTADAATAPALQFPTSMTTSGDQGTVGSSRTLTFGATGVTLTETNTAVTLGATPSANCAMAGPTTNIGSQANVITFTEPDIPATAVGAAAGCLDGTRSSTLALNKPLIAPILHLINLDGSDLVMSGTSTTGDPIGATTIVKNNQMEVTGTHFNTTRDVANNFGCSTNATPPGNPNGGCGSFRLTAASGLIQNFGFTNDEAIDGGGGDGWVYYLSFPTAQLTKSFNPSTITTNQISQLSISITNPNEAQAVTLSPLDFTDTLPAGMTVASGTATNNGACGSPTITNGSGGALAAGDTAIRAANISVAPGATCTIAVTVKASAGSYTNGPSNISSNVGNVVPTGSATLTVDADPPCNTAANGSFEEPNIQGDPNNPEPGTQYVNGWAVWRTANFTIDGWEVVSGTVDILRYFSNHSHGSQSIDLWGTAPSVFQQTFTGLTPGTEYTFSVDYSGLSTTSSRADVLLDQGSGFQLIQTLTPVANAVSNGNAGLPDTPQYTVTWATFTHSFVASGTQATIRFANSVAPGPGSTGLFIDNFAFGGAATCPPPTLPGDVFPTCPINQQPPPTDFTIQQRWATPDVAGQRTMAYQTPVVGDLYGNGQIVAVVAADDEYDNPGGVEPTARNLRIVRGSDGAVLNTIQTPHMNWFGHAVVAIADVDGDGQGEIIVKAAAKDLSPVAHRGRLLAYRNDGTLMWVSDTRYDYNTTWFRSGHSLAVADFNGDGVPEAYIGSQVFNARTGVRLAARASTDSAGCVQNCIQGATVAVDMDGDGQLELVAGNVIYKVNIANPNGAAGNSMVIWRQASAVPSMGDGWTAVADIDLDGDPDVVVVRSPSPSDLTTRLFVWDGQTSAVLGAVTTGVGTSGAEPLIGDIDGDDSPEIVFVTANQLNAYDFVPGTGLVRKWGVPTNDGSGQTSFALFDFNSDGKRELVYRDEQNLRIMDGSGATAVDLATFACSSGTRAEMPVVAAVDATREARILVTCGGTLDSGINRGVLRQFGTASFAWAATRPVWNQQTYFVTHVENDLTIPAPQFPHWTSFNDPNQVCSAGVNRPLNAFQQQVTDLDASSGCPVVCPIPAEVTVTKTASPSDVLTPGGTITYTIAVNNTGPGAATNTVIQDPFPAGIASATWTCAASGGATCPNPSGGPVLPPGNMLNETVPSLPANGTLTYTILATVEPTPPPRVTNTVSATSPVMLCLPDRTPPPCSSTAIVPRPIVELVITKTSAPKPAIPGQALTYTIAVVNNGPDAATDARVQDNVPGALAAFTWTCAQPSGTCSPASGTGSIDTLVDLASGESATITLTGILPAQHLGTLSNVATVTEPPGFEPRCPADNPNCRTTTDNNNPQPTANLTVVKTAPASIQRGGTGTYTLAVTNSGPSDAQAVTLADPTPAGLVLVEAGAPCASGFPCALGPMAAGATLNLPVTLRVPPDYAGPAPIVNRACATSEAVDPNAADSCSETTTPLVEVADLQVTKTVDNDAPAVGGTARFTVTVRNTGPSEARNVALVDQLPGGLTFVSAAPSQGTFDPATGRWAIGTIANASSVALTIDATVTASGALANLATITETETFDPDTSNNSSGSAVNVDTASDLQVHKVADGAAVGVGANVTYTITVRNAGPDEAAGVEITDPLPPGLTFVSAAPSIGSYDPATGVWTVGTLANGGVATLQVTATVAAAGNISNTARITGNVPYDPAPPNNSSGTTINGVGADLQIVKTADRAQVTMGDRVTFTIVTRNNGPGRATGVQVRESLPAGLLYVSSTASQGLYVPETGLWTIDTLEAPGTGTSTATLQVVADVVAAGTFTNVASIAAQDQPDATPSNDGSSLSLGSGELDLKVEIYFVGDADRVAGARAAAVERRPRVAGRAEPMFDFFLRVTNVGTSVATGPITVMVPFPEEIEFTMPDHDWNCTTSGRLVSCTRGDLVLRPGQWFEVGMWGEVRRPVPAGVTAYGTVTHAADFNPSNDVATVLIKAPGSGPADLAVTQTLTGAGAPVLAAHGSLAPASRAGEPAHGEHVATLDVVNRGPGAAEAVSLQAAQPPGVTVLSVEPAQGTCTSSSPVLCELGPIASGAAVRVTLRLLLPDGPPFAHQVTVATRTADADTTNNAATVLATTAGALDPARDTDGDGLTDVWESAMGLNPAVADADGDPDGDGLTNAREAAAGTHPRGFYKQYFAEGVANAFFDTAFDLLNLDAAREAAVVCALMADTGAITGAPVRLGPLGRYTGNAQDMLAGGAGAFSAVIESDRPLATDRLTTWDGRGYGAGLETGVAAPATRWFFAEGATNVFGLFYLLENPDMTTPAEVTVRYLRVEGAPIVQTYTIAPHSRLTIPVNDVPGLASADVSADITSTRPIVAERAMYLSGERPFEAGHVGAGVTAASPEWFFAEGATGAFFDLYLLLANPNPTPATVTVQYQLPDGTMLPKTYTVGAEARRTIIVKDEDAQLAATSVAMAVSASQPIVAERAMWWPAGIWYEAHATVGATATAARWALAGGAVGGPRAESFYALIANQARAEGQARVTAIFDDGTRHARTLDLPPTSRTTVDVGTLFPEALGRRVSLLVESLGVAPVPLVVEGARYSSLDGRLWSAGGAMLGTRLP